MYTEHDARRLLLWLVVFEMVLSVIYLFMAVTTPMLRLEPALVDAFDVNSEVSIPTWFSTVQLFMVGFVLLAAARYARTVNGRIVNTLAVAGLAFLFLSADESAMIHEKMTAALRTVGLTGVLFRGEKGGWIAVYAILALVYVALFRRGLYQLWREYRAESVIALAGFTLFVIGGVGVEVLGYLTASSDEAFTIRAVRMAAEEFLEMAGVSVLLFGALLVGLKIRAQSPAMSGPGKGAGRHHRSMALSARD